MKMRYEINEFKTLKYITAYPGGYSKGKKYPIIFFLHGAGTMGTDAEKVIENPYFKAIEKYKDFPFITIAPHSGENTWFDVLETLKELVINVSKSAFADSKRIYAMGASMGGYGVWQLIMSLPEVFAAAVPICGGGMYWNAAKAQDVSVWAFHGENDNVVFPEESKKMVEALKNAGGNARLTIFSDTNHDSWNKVYSDRKVFEWLQTHENVYSNAIYNVYNNEELYG